MTVADEASILEYLGLILCHLCGRATLRRRTPDLHDLLSR